MKLDKALLSVAQEELKTTIQFCEVAHVGSTYISGEGEDLDLVVLTNNPQAADVLQSLGYKWTGKDEYADDQFKTYRKDVVNVMLTSEREFFCQFQAAAEVCKFLHQQYGFGDKNIRIAIHRILMNEESVHEVQEYLGLVVPQ